MLPTSTSCVRGANWVMTGVNYRDGGGPRTHIETSSCLSYSTGTMFRVGVGDTRRRCQAPLAGLAVPLSVARRGQRCQGFVCYARSTPAIARIEHRAQSEEHRACPGVRASHSHLHLHIRHHPSIFTCMHPSPCSHLPLSLSVDLCVG